MRTVLALLLIAALARPAAADPVPILPVSQVKRGMKGYGKSVFSGTTIEKFDVEVVDVLHHFMPRMDLILIKVSHPIVDKANVIGGMSGSPIYLEDKLVGALAYGWSFSKEPIAGVTPIEYMLAEIERPLIKTGSLDRTALPAGLRACTTPLTLSGFSARGAKILADAFAGYDIEPLQGGDAGGADAKDITLEPGAAIGVSLIRGDLAATATGTVTYVDGDTVLAFGHPFLNGGEVRMPITTAEIHMVLASVARSFKLSSPVKEAGALLQDRNSCILGKKGAVAPMVPVTVKVKSADTGHEAAYRYEVIQHPMFTPSLVNSVLFESIDAADNMMTENTVTADISFKLEGMEPFAYREVLPNTNSVWSPGMVSELFRLLQTPLEKVRLEKFDIALTLEARSRAAVIERAWFDRERARPGEKVTLTVQVRRWRGELDWQKTEIEVPADERPGELEFAVTSRAETPPDLPPPLNARDLVAQIAARPPGTAFVVTSAGKSLNLRVQGQVLPSLPNSALAILGPAALVPADLAFAQRRRTVETPHVLSGSARATLRIEK